MCGITGLIRLEDSKITNLEIIQAWESMFGSSLRRGSDASGIIGIVGEKIFTYKRAGLVSDLLSDRRYADLLVNLKQAGARQVLALVGHSRLVTNGRASLGENNQPVSKDEIILIHNGIVVNDLELRVRHNYPIKGDLDTETLANLLIDHGISLEPATSVTKTFSELKGNSTIAGIVRNRQSIIIATNNGSMYFGVNQELGIIAFGSEPLFIQASLELFKDYSMKASTFQLLPNKFVEIRLDALSSEKLKMQDFKLNEKPKSIQSPLVNQENMASEDFSIPEFPNFDTLKRCTTCILPSTFPGIELNNDGLCRYCSGGTAPAPRLLGTDHLTSALKLKAGGSTDSPILVGVSGGRDSCYGLHYLKSVLKLNVVAYTYDWGMVTDLASKEYR